MKPKRLVLALALCLALTAPSGARAAEPDPADPADVPWDGYIVRLRQDASVSLLADGSPEAFLDSFLKVETLEEALEIPEELVEYIEPDYLAELFADPEPEPGAESPAGEPNDPLYADHQWNLQTVRAYEASRLLGCTGRGVKVGFVDSGINRSHEDFTPGNISGINSNGDGLPYDQDIIGHGTFTAGITAARTDNGLGLAGIAPDVELRIYRAFGGSAATASDVARAVTQAAADGCQVVNLSLGVRKYSQTLEDAVAAALNQGVILIAAVGNDGTGDVMYPAGSPGVIGVGSVNQDLTVSSFSQRNETVDFCAPGDHIAGLGYTSDNAYRISNSSTNHHGTSYAAPMITALAALALEYDPTITGEEFFTLLKSTARDLGEPGYDIYYGHGLADALGMAEALIRRCRLEYRPGQGAELPEDAIDAFRTYRSYDLPVPLRPGYLFTGWYEDEACQGASLLRLPAGTMEDQVLYAGWIPDRTPRMACLTDYNDRGRMISLAWFGEQDWADAPELWAPQGNHRVFWMDGAFRPAQPPPGG